MDQGLFHFRLNKRELIKFKKWEIFEVWGLERSFWFFRIEGLPDFEVNQFQKILYPS
jgi:hypothetical protein